MTTSTAEYRHLSTPTPRRSGGRMGTVLVLIVALVMTGVMRQVATRQQERFRKPGQGQVSSTLGSMDSFALALLLGGLRGPLVMFLWSTSETQKVDRDLEDFDTKVEWIRLLQPEFDSVAIFQIWNKAYNISAMMASPANKYAVVMEAVDYGDSYDNERPGDVNILGAISNVYGGKLGSNTLPEFNFFMRQYRLETMTDAARDKMYPDLKGRFNRIHRPKGLPTILDDNGNIRPELMTATTPNRPEKTEPTTPLEPGETPLVTNEWNDGSELQYLAPYQPFRYGVSALAMSYNYAKRSEVAISAEGQKPLQLSAMVVDSRPGLQLKLWAEDEIHRARNLEGRGFGIQPAGPPEQVNIAMAELNPAKPVDAAAIDEAIYRFNSVEKIATDGLAEYERHLTKSEFAMRRSTYESHVADLKSMAAVSVADRDYLLGTRATNPDERHRLLTASSSNYLKAMRNYEFTSLRYYTEEEALLPAEIAVAIGDFGDRLKAINETSTDPTGDYDKLYNSMTSESFRDRVPEKAFADSLAAMFGKTPDGKKHMESIRWSGGATGFDGIAGTDGKICVTTAVIKVPGEPERKELVRLSHLGTGWKIDSARWLFPEQAPASPSTRPVKGGWSKTNLPGQDDPAIDALFDVVKMTAAQLTGAVVQHADERAEYLRSATRCKLRIQKIQDLLRGT